MSQTQRENPSESKTEQASIPEPKPGGYEVRTVKKPLRSEIGEVGVGESDVPANCECVKKPEPETRKRKKKKKKSSVLWAVQIFILTFFLSLSFSVLSQLVADNTPIYVAFFLLMFIIAINILFDVVGVAAASCSVEPFLAMAAKKKKGARMAVRIAKNAEKVSNICADVIGDICGIISGALGASIVVIVTTTAKSLDSFLVSVLFSALIAAVTVGGKSLGKKFAMTNCQNIIFTTAKVLSVFSKR